MLFQNENEYLIHLLYCAVHDTVPENAPEHISLETVFHIGAAHEVANIAYTAIKKVAGQVPDELMDRWRAFYYHAVKRDAAQKKARGEILDALHSHGIYTLEVQGTVVKQYYPQSHLRMMSDLDFIIPEEKLREAEKVMRSIGYKTKNQKEIEIDAIKGNIAVELHSEFFAAGCVTRAALTEPYTHAVCGENYTATVTDTTFYLFHLLHTIKHCEQKGVGLRRIMDLYYLEPALKDKADREYIDKVLKEHGFYQIKEQLLAIKDHWLCGIEPETDVAELEADVLEAGNHGTLDIFCKHTLERKRADGKRFYKLRGLLAFLFPSKTRLYDNHPFFKKHRLPIVLCWFLRSFCIFNPKGFRLVGTLLSRVIRER